MYDWSWVSEMSVLDALIAGMITSLVAFLAALVAVYWK